MYDIIELKDRKLREAILMKSSSLVLPIDTSMHLTDVEITSMLKEIGVRTTFCHRNRQIKKASKLQGQNLVRIVDGKK